MAQRDSEGAPRRPRERTKKVVCEDDVCVPSRDGPPPLLAHIKKFSSWGNVRVWNTLATRKRSFVIWRSTLGIMDDVGSQ